MAVMDKLTVVQGAVIQTTSNTLTKHSNKLWKGCTFYFKTELLYIHQGIFDNCTFRGEDSLIIDSSCSTFSNCSFPDDTTINVRNQSVAECLFSFPKVKKLNVNFSGWSAKELATMIDNCPPGVLVKYWGDTGEEHSYGLNNCELEVFQEKTVPYLYKEWDSIEVEDCRLYPSIPQVLYPPFFVHVKGGVKY